MVDEVVVCSPHPLEDIPEGIKSFVYDGEESDVLARYYHCFLENRADYILRITSDCPILDPNLIDFVINEGVKSKADYCSNVMNLTFPDGMDCELISMKMLFFLHATMNSEYAREHVTIGIRENKKMQSQFDCVSVECRDKDYHHIKWSIDSQDDLDRVRGLCE